MKNFTDFVIAEIKETMIKEISMLISIKEDKAIDAVILKGLEYIVNNDLLNNEYDIFFSKVDSYPVDFLKGLDEDDNFTDFTTVKIEDPETIAKEKEKILINHATCIFVVLFKIYQTLCEISEEEDKIEIKI